MVTIKDVAAEAGVAISTVSKVLKGYPGVSAETKEKVNKAVAVLGFTPNAVASALSSKKSGRIALIMNIGSKTGAADEINMQYLSGAISAALDYRLDAITLFYSMIAEMDVTSLTAYLRSQSVEGLIIFGLSKEDDVLLKLVDAGTFKSVIVDAPISNNVTSAVCIDGEKAQYDIIHKTMEGVEGSRILYIAGKKSSYSTDSRLLGVKKAEAELGTEATIRYGNYSEMTAREITFELARKCDMIACGSDLMAIGAMRALMEMDIFKPVCGFDGIMLMAYAGKQMNTVKQDFEKISKMAVAELKHLIDGGEGRILFADYELVRMTYDDALKQRD